jgi:cold shock CspA family protein
MQVPLEKSFQDLSEIEHERAEQVIRDQVLRLERLADDIIACRIGVSRPQRHQRAGSPYRVRILVTMPPHHELVVTKEPGQNDQHDEIRTVLRDAFHAMERQVKETAERRRRDVKNHAVEPTGFVVKLFTDSGYGFIKTDDGDELYFHANSVARGEFDRIAIGTQVRFVATVGDKGPQATTVQIVDKPGVRRMEDGEAEQKVPATWKP